MFFSYNEHIAQYTVFLIILLHINIYLRYLTVFCIQIDIKYALNCAPEYV